MHYLCKLNLKPLNKHIESRGQVFDSYYNK